MATVVQVPKRVIIKFSGKVMRSHSGTDSCVTNDSEQDISMKAKATTSGGGGCNKRKSESLLDAQRLMRRKMDHGRDPELDMVKAVSVAADSKKRKPAYMVDSQRPIRRKMDRGVKLKCGHILKELSNHRFGWVFSKPVDPVALRIPDYFDIITDPMDLGTIKSKLENNKYSFAEEFASDVNLTFSNAMRYNPPGDDVNQWAKELDGIFRSMWKPAVRKWNLESSGVGQGISENESETYGNDKNYSEKPSSNAATTVALEEKERLWKEYMSMVDGKISEKLVNTLKSSKLICLMEGKTGKFKSDRNDVDDSAWLELRRWLKRIKAAKVVLEKTDNTGRCFLSAEVAHRGGASGSVDGKPSMSSSSSKCCSCGGMRCHCGNQHKSTLGSPNDKSFKDQRPAPRVDAVKKDLSMNSSSSNQGVRKKDLPTHATSSDSAVVKKDLPSHATSLDSNAARKDLRTQETSSGLNGVRKDPPTHARISGSNAVKKDPVANGSSDSNLARNNLPTHETSSKSNVAKIDLPVCATTSGQDSHGSCSVKDEEKTSASTAFSPPLSTATPGEGCTWLDDHYSLEKAQRAAMLKSRFADTILRAKGNSDPKRLQEEKERLERLQREEEARIKAILKEQQLHLRKQVEKARQDALSALKMMERTVIVYDNLESLKELENLCGCPPSHCLYGDCFRRQLQLIGLSLKEEDDLVEDEDVVDDSVLCENGDREEGEI